MSQREALIDFLRKLFDGFEPEPYAIFRRTGSEGFPMKAATEEELVAQLDKAGNFIPLPKEPAALANIVEVTLVDFMIENLAHRNDIQLTRGTERGYPDIELDGSAFGGRPYAIDVKVARRKATKSGKVNPKRTQSRITLYTGNTYFRYPSLKWSGILRPFDEYAAHLDILVIYTLDESRLSRMGDLEIIIQEAWRIGSKERSSTTREYLGAVDDIDRLRAGKGDFATEADFYNYWRKFPFKTGKTVENELRKLIAGQAKP